MSELDHESESLFRDARRAFEPTAHDRDRLRARIATQLAVAAAAVALPREAAAAAKVSLALKIGAGIVAIGIAGAIGLHLRTPAKHSEIASAIPSSGVALAVPSASLATTPEPTVVTIAAADLPSVAPSTLRAMKPARSTAADQDEEAALVGQIDAALRAGDTSMALRLASDHEHRFPHGLLGEEREGARVLARCMTGAPANASAFLAAHPRSPMRARIAAACTKDEP